MARNVAETRVRIALDDELSVGLLKAQRNITGFNKTITATSGAFGGVVGNITGLTAALTGLYGAIDLTAQAIKSPFEFAKSMETNKLGIAGIMQSMVQLNGRTLQWSESLAISDRVIKRLNQNALETAATSSDLVESFRALLGPGLAAGMSMDQLIEFSTIGANAVKSLGLGRQQVVQELRDLVQGGIRPQSSTLATAMGLTDADIAAAKKSSEGLFNFLIRRMEGFKKSSREVPKTTAGLLDQIEEGYTRATATGAEPLENYYKTVLDRVGDLFLDNQSFKLNESYVESVREFSEHAVNAAKGLETVGEVAGTVLKPAVEMTGNVLGVLADNTDKVALGFAAWKIGETALDLNKVAKATYGTYEAQTLLGGVLQRGQGYLSSYEQAILKERNAAVGAADAIIKKRKAVSRAYKEQREVNKVVEELEKKQQIELANRLKDLVKRYEALGVSAKEAARLQLEAARLIKKGKVGTVIDALNEQEKHYKNAQRLEREATGLRNLQNGILALGGTVEGLSAAYLMLSDDQDSFFHSLAESGLAVGTGVTALGLLIDQLGNLKKAYDAVMASKGLTRLAAILGGTGLAGAGIGALVGGAFASIYGALNGISDEEAIRRYRTAWYGKDPVTTGDFRRLNDTNDIKIDESKLSPRYFGPNKLTKEQEDAIKLLKRMQEQTDTLAKDVGSKITKHTGTALEYANAQLERELSKMNETIGKARRAGVSEDTLKSVERQMETYQRLQQAQNQRDYLTKNHDNQMSLLQALEDTYAEHYSVLNRMRAEELESYKRSLLEELKNTEINEEEKLRLRREYAEASQELNKVQSSNIDEAWKQSLDYLKNIQYDQVATVKGGIDEMLGAITNFGQNMLTEQKSFSDRADELFKDLANSIINTMMKVIMQGLVMNSIMSLFPGLGGGNKEPLQSWNMSSYKNSWNGGNKVFAFANGGVAQGWAIVGERGPELAHFGQPARIYTAEQTQKALGGGGNVNVKINLSNESGQQLMAEQTGGGFDGDSYVVNVVIRALETNKGGLRTIMKGAVAR